MKPLIAALSDSSGITRRNAARALGLIGDPRAVEPLAAALRDADSSVRESAEEAIVRLEAAAVDTMNAALRDSTPSVRAAAVRVFGKIGDPRNAAAVTAALTDPDADVCRQAARALERLGVQPAEPSERAAWLVALERWDDAAALGAAALDPLINALRRFAAPARWNAAEVLGRIDDGRAVEPLIIALHDENGDVRRCAIRALARHCDPRAVEPLISLLTKPNTILAGDAAAALGAIGDTRAIEPLVGLVKRNTFFVDATRALELLDREQVIEQLLAASYDAASRAALAHALAALHYEPRDAAEKIRLLVGRGRWTDLAELGAAAVDPLIEMLRDSDPDMRCNAASTLGKIGDRRAVEPLLAAAKEDQAAVRRAAAKSLAALADPRSFDVLVEALRDPELASHAVAALDAIGDPRAAAGLTAVLGHWLLRERVAEVLIRFGSEATFKPLIAALLGDNRDRAKAAADVLVRTAPAWSTSHDAKDAFPAVLERLETSHLPRPELADVLGHMGRARAITPMILSLMIKYRGHTLVRFLPSKDRGGDEYEVYEKAVVSAAARLDPDWRERAAGLLLKRFMAGEHRGDTIALLRRLDPEWARTESARDVFPKLLAELANGWNDAEIVRHCTPAFVEALDAIDSGWVPHESAQRGLSNLVGALVHMNVRNDEVAWIVPVLDRVDPAWGVSDIVHATLSRLIGTFNDAPIPIKQNVLPRLERIIEHCRQHLTIDELRAVARLESYQVSAWIESTTSFPDEPNGYTAHHKADSSHARFLAREELARRGEAEH